ncbi:hypothetical protein COW36_13980 [bacterium (Candidatus Blackallbacteria) CG17_big_fil_post_rev_8_21_14_2_50_48_46]|uniref:Uncharacterized protein n=1 Tax=bacterium (Candidatus Blackallbacteria) CG17_big_fil_post_rev_8_21_14_2_50_48_46 TaxID=2014261 RepID=A0A2M7G324_9BACT|nr:MAG: hypothetical protein COW64_23450 [bacterium (Candidatus Blackallbacteria) CG18_big_fil_WC_8_21_14_2_50_49_26]PIW16235.1 MAG: hypothetical protein COW36_13980 [bacterium (Candidatus Blackallbacteria) CG17_big_fil_post_rev_8_21_14_2_50_48_46]PIW49883.1 MAG: hypothetical protein COW20_04325 [bacterium (Candidatus Blackallbacteria) CG13_big_fil_rev_8_21_14_2_50_49_14]
MRSLPLFLLFSLMFSGCGILLQSPLGDKQEIQLTGKLSDEEGTPFQGKVTLQTSRQTYTEKTNPQGIFAISLLGFESKGLLNQAEKIKVQAQAENGSSVQQNIRLLSPETELSPMRFWNALSGPPDQARLKSAPQFSWKAAHETPDSYGVELSRDGYGVIWSQTTSTLQSQVVPQNLLENQASYHWSISANYPDYQARSSVRHFKTEKIVDVIPIFLAQSGGKNWPQFHDGLYEYQLSEAFELKSNQAIELLLDLSKSHTVGAVVIASSGFSATAQISITDSAESPASTAEISAKLSGYQALELPANSHGRYIHLRFIGNAGFLNLHEIRVLAPQ